ncbi:Uncharacterised protein [BD1-7 clade bacterium]|uniref:Lipoprotein n=1 Tax=BD1-7 clade bacterium TaxID=2029982 RepID=A0A5S9PWA4_9GAMM|nr:Uncharacterised protein [BD1-7 clade bacterium]CAA0109025.1 Uncharacterised protein [BD1-7 clade bacterium]
MSFSSRMGVTLASCAILVSVTGCQTEERPGPVPTQLSVTEPLPAGNSVTLRNITDRMAFLYGIRGAQDFVGERNPYVVEDRFDLLLNGVDITNAELYGICGTERYWKGGDDVAHPGNQTADMDPETCFSVLKQNQEVGLRLVDVDRQSARGPSGYRVSGTSTSGTIIFEDLQGLSSAIRVGENTLTMIPKGSNSSVSARFFYFEDAPRLAVTCTYHGLAIKQPNQPCSDFSAPIANQQFAIQAKIVDGAPIAGDGVDGVTGLPRYKITFKDRNGDVIDAQVRIDDDRETLHAQFPSYPDVDGGFTSKVDISYSLTDVLGQTRSDAFSIVGRRYNPAIGLMVNQPALDSVQPLFNPMLEEVIDFGFSQVFTSPHPVVFGSDTNERAEIGEFINAPPVFSASIQNMINEMCPQVLRNLASSSAAGARGCALYLNLESNNQTGIDFGFDKVGGGANGYFDILLPKFSIRMELAGYEQTLSGTQYLGSFNTTIDLNDALLRGVSKLSVDPTKLLGFGDIEEFRFMFSDAIGQFISDRLFDGSYVPQLRNTRCDSICGSFPVNDANALVTLGIFTGQVNFSTIVEDTANTVLPEILRSFIDTFPLIGDLKTSLDDDGATLIVDDSDPNRRVQRTLTATFVGTKDVEGINPFIDDRSGLFRMGGGFELVDAAGTRIGTEILGNRYINPNGYPDLFNFVFTNKTDTKGVSDPEPLDMVVGISANMINQFLATRFSSGYFDNNPIEFTVEESASSPFERLANAIYLNLQGISVGDSIKTTITPLSPPQVRFVGGKESSFQISWDLLFGLIKGGITDPAVTAAANLEVSEARILIERGTEVILDATANIDLGTNIHHQDGKPYLFVRTPEPPRTENEEPTIVADQRLLLAIQEINQISSATGFDLATVKNSDGEITDRDAYGEMKAQVGARILAVYEEQLFDDSGAEVLLNDLLTEFLVEKSEIIDFSSRGDAIEFPNPSNPSDTVSILYQRLFLGQDAVEIYPYFRWFTVDESGGWLTMGIDVKAERHSTRLCPNPATQLSVCYQE